MHLPLSRIWSGVAQTSAIRLGELALARGKVGPESLKRALAAQEADEPRRPIGQILVEQGAITTAECADLLLRQEKLVARPPLPRIGEFLLLHELGRGGMAVVWKAWDTRLGRAVAIKRLHGEGARREALLRRGAKLEARIDHPNIVPIYGLIEHEGSPCVVMGLVEGRTLDVVGPDLPLRRLLEVVRDAARAIDAAHRAGVVHRDIKPGNLMLDRDGKVHVLDFGIAKGTGPDASLTRTGAVVGTPVFMAPEQAAGEPRRIGPRTDVYGLGATLYTLVAGRPPFTGLTTADVLMKVVRQEAPPLRSCRRSVPDPVAVIVHKALERDPARRYANAAVLADDLDRFLKGDEILARPPSTLSRVVRRLRRSRAILAAAALGAIAIGLGAWGVLQGRARVANRSATRHLAEAQRSLAEAQVYLHRPAVDLGPMWELLENVRYSLDAAERADPSRPEVFYLRGRILELEGDAAGAEIQYARALSLDPQLTACRVQRALLRLNRQMMKLRLLDLSEREVPFPLEAGEVAQDLEQVLAAGPSVAKTDRFYARVALHVARQEYAEVDALCAGEESRRRATEGLFRLHAFALHRLGRTRDALARLEEALRLEYYDGQAQAEAAYLRGCELKEWDAALQHADAAAAVLRREPYVAVLRGLALYSLHHHARAAEDLDRALVLDPNRADANCILAMALTELGRFEEAERHYRRGVGILERQGRTTRALAMRTNLGLVLDRMKRTEEAKTEIDKVLRDCPEYAPAHRSLGSLHLAQGRLDAAWSEFQRATELDPHDADAWAGRAYADQLRDLWDDAVAEYSQAIRLCPSDGPSHRGRGVCLANLERLDEAMRDFDRAIALSPEDGEAWAARARGRLDAGRIEEANDDLSEALHRNPRCAMAHHLLAKIGWLRCDWVGMERHADLAVAEFREMGLPRSVAQALMYRGIGREELGRGNEAQADYEEGIRLDPGDATKHLHLGKFFAKRARWEEAEIPMVAAAELDPTQPEIWMCLGTVRLERGAPDGAETALNRALALRPRWPAALVRRAEARIRLGHDAEAESDLRIVEEVLVEDKELRAVLSPIVQEMRGRLSTAFRSP